MKKMIYLISVIFILISLFSIPSFAENKVQLSLTNETVYAGEEFKLNLFISDNSKMSGAVIDINYDKNMLEFVSATQGTILDANANISIKNIDGDSSKVRFTYLSPSSSVTSEGVLMTITFKALDNATGNTDLIISIPNAGDFVTQDLQNIAYEVSGSVVKIINTTHDDQSDDTSSSTTDEVSEQPSHDIIQSTTDENDDNELHNDNNNGDNILIIILFVVGLAFITVGAVMLIKTKKNKE